MDTPVQGDATGETQRATPRRPAASLTETAGRAPLTRHGHRAGKGAR
ncbi:DUF6380 family protein [Streptomyces sp. NPDC005876]|jgi:hypothetical protein